MSQHSQKDIDHYQYDKTSQHGIDHYQYNQMSQLVVRVGKKALQLHSNFGYFLVFTFCLCILAFCLCILAFYF